MNDAVKKIRFIDSHYNIFFFIEDGENIVLTYANGEKVVKACTYIDECHTQVGHSVYHICEFSEIMERNGTRYEPEKTAELPPLCYYVLPSSGELIMLKRNQKGYNKCSWSAPYREQNEGTAAHNNARLGVTPQQAAAMFGGSLFGWDTPAAKPQSYDFKGNPRIPSDSCMKK